MNKNVILIFLTLILTTMSSNSQSIQNARYMKEDLDKFLSTNTRYPIEAVRSQIQGDVVYSFTINKNGSLENLALMNYPSELLLNSSKISMSLLNGEWKPALLNDTPIDKKYQIVFRFRTYMDTNPFDYKGQSRKLIEKKKYEKALMTLDSGVQDNMYDYELYDLRSKVKEALGDSEGAKKDESISSSLKDEIMAVIDVNEIIVRKTAPLGVTKTVVVSQ